MPEKRNRLSIKRIERVSLVDAGDNPTADIVIHKRRADTGSTPADEGKSIGQSIADAINKALGRADKHEPEVAMPKTEEPKVETPVEKAEEPKAETFDKAAIEAMQKRLEAAEKRAQDADERVAKMEMQKREAEYIEKAKAYTHLPVKAAEFGPLLRKISDGEKLSDDEAKELDRVLAAANEANRTSKLFAEIGAGGSEDGSATARVEKKARELVAADPKLTIEVARAQVYKSDPALAEAVRAEDRERIAARGH